MVLLNGNIQTYTIGLYYSLYVYGISAVDTGLTESGECVPNIICTRFSKIRHLTNNVRNIHKMMFDITREAQRKA